MTGCQGPSKGPSATVSISATFPFLPQTSLHGHDKTRQDGLKLFLWARQDLKPCLQGRWNSTPGCDLGTGSRDLGTALLDETGEPDPLELAYGLSQWRPVGLGEQRTPALISPRTTAGLREPWTAALISPQMPGLRDSQRSCQTPMPNNSWLRRDDERPLKYSSVLTRRRTLLLIAFAWVFPPVLLVPISFPAGIIEVRFSRASLVCNPLYSSNVSYSLSLTCFIFFPCSAIMTFCNLRLWIAAKRQRLKLRRSWGGGYRPKVALRVLVPVMTVYYTCWTPYMVIMLYNVCCH